MRRFLKLHRRVRRKIQRLTMSKVIPSLVNDWQVGCNDIKERMVKMYESDSWTDCVFLFGTDQLVPAHKNVLAASSPVFAAMFFGGMPERGGPIRIEDILPGTFISMLKYIYTDVIDIGSFDDACALYYAAHKYRLKHLQIKCSNYLIDNLTPENCCLAYEFSQMFDESDLLEACEKVMKTKTEEVLVSSGFLAASLTTLHFLYSMDDLNIYSDLPLFEALERYNTARCKKEDALENSELDKKDNRIAGGYQKTTDNNNVYPAVKDEENKGGTIEGSKAEKITVHHIIKLIRFLTMSPEEFARGPAVSSLLTQSEILSIFININHAKTNVPLPLGFSTEKKRYKQKKNLLGKSQTTIKFRFTVPECENLEHGDAIQFPLVYGANYNWQVYLELDGKVCYAHISGTGISNWKAFILKINLLSKESVLKREFKSSTAYNYHDTINLGSIGNWDDIKKMYMENGALTFDVELELEPLILFCT